VSESRILETERLILRELAHSDADFVLRLLNTPGWLQFIGDKQVRSVSDAIQYLNNGPIASYREHGFGLWLVWHKDREMPIGMCGLIKRQFLDDVDIGFAFLPEFFGSGFGYEIAAATMWYAKNELKIPKIVAITKPNNIASIKLLLKLDLHFVKQVEISLDDVVFLFEPKK
jgi:RimJ/RimL family protein N-acetyltransferase